MNLGHEIKKRLSIFKNFYDVIRVMDPINKTSYIITENEVQEVNYTCYCMWNRSNACDNCVSMRALTEQDTFIKMEHVNEKVMLITATSVEIEGNTYIVEILKDITKNSTVNNIFDKNRGVVEELISSVNERAVRDELTGLYNRRYINERLPIDLNYSKLNNSPLSIIMADIDFFKKVNDKYGHLAGDRVLKEYSDLILNSIRSNSHWASRFGGEEFLIVLNNANLKNAYDIAEEIRIKVENTVFQFEGQRISITSSFGVYCTQDYNIEVSQLLSKADDNLYEAKFSGRNRTVAKEGNVQQHINIDERTNIENKNLKLLRIKNQIDELRETLNEACCTIDEGKSNPDRLFISECLDELIVEYMKEFNS
ncbi:GGDEF domain-containing protein [Clostridium sp. YIM B02515]|uniref:GGDEF domain-containing protein n=1 Tax=Clostridium rhizosphaerae TaxID=2803861 RepID=A0ABS1T5A5_9CLOT|nr:diguanylate cyclase [Clostridium rhizosphaerae]MBL4934517.1 GGDEF domain-containing protein [Clostridium rhizosphaerae]